MATFTMALAVPLEVGDFALLTAMPTQGQRYHWVGLHSVTQYVTNATCTACPVDVPAAISGAVPHAGYELVAEFRGRCEPADGPVDLAIRVKAPYTSASCLEETSQDACTADSDCVWTADGCASPAKDLIPAEVPALHGFRIDIFRAGANRTDLPTQSEDGMLKGFLLTHDIRFESGQPGFRVIPVRAPPLASLEVRVLVGLQPLEAASVIIIYAPDGMNSRRGARGATRASSAAPCSRRTPRGWTSPRRRSSRRPAS